MIKTEVAQRVRHWYLSWRISPVVDEGSCVGLDQILQI